MGTFAAPPSPRALQEGAPPSLPPTGSGTCGALGKAGRVPAPSQGRQADAGEDRRRRGGGRIQKLCAHLCRAVCL